MFHILKKTIKLDHDKLTCQYVLELHFSIPFLIILFYDNGYKTDSKIDLN